MDLDALAQTVSLTTQSKLRRGLKDARHARSLQISQRSKAPAGMGNWQISRIGINERGEIELNLRNIAMRTGAREKLRAAVLGEKVEDDTIEGRVDAVPVQFPVPINQINLDRASDDRSIFDSDGRILEIGSGFTIPEAELNDFGSLAGCRLKFPTEFTGKPARLEFELARNSGQRD
jgi:hypothetical protein